MAKATTTKKAARKRPAAKRATKKAATKRATKKTAAKRATKKAAKNKPKREPLEERNGVKRPRPGGKTAVVWEIADKLSKGGKTCPERKDVLAEADKQGCNPAMASSQYASWRVFHGFKGRKAAKKK